MSKVNFSQLEYYVAAVSEGSFVQAAQKNYVTTQAVSRAVRELENEFGVALMVREGRGIRPTPIGLLFFDQAKLILEECGSLKSIASLSEGRKISSRGVCLAICTAECRGNLYPKRLFEMIDRLNPNSMMSPVFGLNAYCLALLRSGFAQMALVLGPERKGEGLVYRYMTSVEPQFAVSIDNPLAVKGNVKAGDLNTARMALPLDTGSLAYLKHWLSAIDSEVVFESVGLNAGDHRRFLEKGGVVMVLGNDQSVLPGVNRLVLPQTGEARLRLPVYACASEDIDAAFFATLCSRIRNGLGIR